MRYKSVERAGEKVDKSNLVTIIVPVYNVEKYIGRCLDSILLQDYTNIEILCIDDCSPDSSSQIIHDYEKKYENVYYYTYEKNGGLGYARDYGISKAKGEYLLFIDSDDYINTDYVSTYIKAATADDIDIVMGSYNRDIDGKISPVQISDSQNTPWIYPSACIRMYRRSFLIDNNLNFHGIRTYEDGFFNERCMMKNPKVKIINYTGYNYVLNPNSITKKSDNKLKKYEGYVKNYFDLWEEAKNISYKSDVYDIIEYLYVQGITINMLYNLRHAGISNIDKFYSLRKNILKTCFPEYKKNKWIGLSRLSEELFINRFVLWIYIIAEKLHLDKILLFLIAL